MIQISDEAPIETGDNANDTIEKKELKTEQVRKTLHLINEACDLISESDPDQERLIAFQQNITTGCSVYKTWLNTEKSKNMKQKNIKDFCLVLVYVPQSSLVTC